MKVCIYSKPYNNKSHIEDIEIIDSADFLYKDDCNIEELVQFIDKGYSWCPSILNEPKRNQENFREQQLFALDFNGNISLDTILQRCDKYSLRPVIIYETLSSDNWDRFRLIFKHTVPVFHIQMVQVIQNILCKIFKEADCSFINPVKLYCGGRNAYVYSNEPFDFYNLLVSLMIYLESTYTSKHISRELKRICSKNMIAMQGSQIKIDKTPVDLVPVSMNMMRESGDFLSYSYIYLGDGKKSPFIITVYFNRHNDQLSLFDNQPEDAYRKKKVRRFNYDNLENHCTLFSEFQSGERWLHHKELFHIMTNLIQCTDGRKVFLDTLSNSFEYVKDIQSWRYQTKIADKNNYPPSQCSKLCPYTDICNHEADIILTGSRKPPAIERVKQQHEFYPLHEAEQDFTERFYESLYNSNHGITVIKAQTGLGKTVTYLEYLKKADLKCLIAVPTNRLKRQVYNDAVKMGIMVYMTPSIEDISTTHPDLYNELQDIFDLGFPELIRKKLEEYNNTNPSLIIQNYLNRINIIKSFSGHVITTHATLVHCPKKALDSYKIIIDEDIINKLIKIKSIPFSTLLEFKQRFDGPKELLCKLNEIMRLSETPTYKKIPSIRLKTKEKFSLYNQLKMLPYINFFELMESNSFYYDKRSDTFNYIFFQRLNKNLSYLMLSATANKAICKLVFSSNLISFTECKIAKNIGKIILYHDRTYSRYCLDKNPQIFSDLKKTHPDTEMITYKNKNPYAKAGEIYFGAAEGHNNLSGQDIVVVGTPNKPEFVYKLMAFYFNLDIDFFWCMQSVEYNGFKAYLKTYNDVNLRNIQFWMIESELEQAIGRARIIRNNCTVHLYSRFPILQSILNEEFEEF